MTERIYLSGPMTGKPDLNVPAFNAAARALRSWGWSVVNPAEISIDLGDGLPYETYLREDIKRLCDCKAIVMLPGWEDSKGAHLELHIAHRLGIEVLFFEKMLAEAA